MSSVPKRMQHPDTVYKDDSQTLTNKTLGNTNTITLKDTLFTLQDDGDATKQAKFQLSGITTGTTRVLTVPNADIEIVGKDLAQTLTNKTLTSPVINVGSDATNDMYVRNASGVYTRIPGPTAALQVLTANAANPTTVAPSFQAAAGGTQTFYTYKSNQVITTTQTNYSLFTTEAGRGKFYTTEVIVEFLSSSSPTGTLSLGIGYTASNYNDVINGFSISNGFYTSGFNKYALHPMNGILITTVPANTIYRARTQTALTAGTLTVNFYITGFYEN
jgi:hypothetical protein